MTWVKLDDGCAEHPKLLGLGVDGFSLWIAGLCYCNRNLTDGFIPDVVAYRLFGANESSVERLSAAGVWSVVSGGFQVHDYLDFQPSKEAVVRERGKAAERQARWRDKQRSNGVSNGVSNTRPEPVPVNPPGTPNGVPSPPQRQPDGSDLAKRLLAAFNEAFSTRYGSRAHLAKIDARIQEFPDCSEAEHLAVIEAAHENQWWKGAPSPAVVWGSSEVFESYREAAGGTVRRLAAVQASEHRKQRERAEARAYEEVAVPPPPEAVEAMRRLGAAVGSRKLEEGHHEAA